ncbi:hypothetical protein BDR26DRAFT_904960 [Obelidium mucronatum]|nr:hypothetical protein BDR26DRAFT_904960 [Obelidium mucronatum]
MPMDWTKIEAMDNEEYDKIFDQLINDNFTNKEADVLMWLDTLPQPSLPDTLISTTATSPPANDIENRPRRRTEDDLISIPDFDDALFWDFDLRDDTAKQERRAEREARKDSYRTWRWRNDAYLKRREEFLKEQQFNATVRGGTDPFKVNKEKWDKFITNRYDENGELRGCRFPYPSTFFPARFKSVLSPLTRENEDGRQQSVFEYNINDYVKYNIPWQASPDEETIAKFFGPCDALALVAQCKINDNNDKNDNKALNAYPLSSDTNDINKVDSIIDSGASSHFFVNRANFQDYSTTDRKVTVGGGGTVNIVGKGSVTLSANGREVKLQEAYHVPEFESNLVSIQQQS